MHNIQREIVEDKFCVVRLDQIGTEVNLFSIDTLTELHGHLDAIASAPHIHGVIFISGKERVFHAGADLRALQKMSQVEAQYFLEMGQEVFNRIASLKIPTVAAIHGVCLGGGCELALACKYRIATPDRVTKIGLPETKLGILPAWGGSTRLPRLIGVIRALDIILAGKTPTAKQALRHGLIDAIAPRELLLSAAVRLLKGSLPVRQRPWWTRPLPNRLLSLAISTYARKKALAATRGHYPAVLKACDIVLNSAGTPTRDSLEHERHAVLDLVESTTCKNLVRLFFMGERARKSEGAKIKPVASAEVIGAGVMGSGIAQWLSSRGVRVILRDVNPQAVAMGMQRIRKLFGDRRVFTDIEARDGLDRISPVVSDVPLDHVDLVIEAAVEKMAAKKQIFAKLDTQASNAQTLLATNTSALSLDEIAGATKNPGRVVGLHFFNPVHKMQLVEVVAGPQAKAENIQRAVQFVHQIGKLPVVVKDSPGFLVNRILVPYLLEAGLLFESGARIEDIDQTMLDFGMPMGPLRLIDEVGVDIAADVAATLSAHFSDRLRVPEILTIMATAGWLGRKSGCGFYVHSGKQKSAPNPGLNAFRRNQTVATLDRKELQLRLSLLLANEAARCVEEKIATGPEAVDFAMVMGTGFAPFRGGPLRFAESFGLRRMVDELDRLSVVSGSHFTRCDLLEQLAIEGRRFHDD